MLPQLATFLAILFMLFVTFFIGFYSAESVHDEQRFIRKLLGRKWLLLLYALASGILLALHKSNAWFSSIAVLFLALNFVFGASAKKNQLLLIAIVQVFFAFALWFL